MKIVFIADIIGQPGRDIVRHKLPELIQKEEPDFIIANAENAAGGKGLTGPIAAELFSTGINAITLGNHTFDRKEIDSVIYDVRILRPLNYPPSVAGNGWGIFTLANGALLAVISLMGRVYMPLTDCPFRAVSSVLEIIRQKTKNIFVDFHAEITSEKLAMGLYLDGQVSAVIGTHTHVPTADEKIMLQGTAYLTDAGMTGPAEGVIGMDKEIVLKKYLTGIPQHFVVAKGISVMQGCIVELNPATGKAKDIRRFAM